MLNCFKFILFLMATVHIILSVVCPLFGLDQKTVSFPVGSTHSFKRVEQCLLSRYSLDHYPEKGQAIIIYPLTDGGILLELTMNATVTEYQCTNHSFSFAWQSTSSKWFSKSTRYSYETIRDADGRYGSEHLMQETVVEGYLVPLAKLLDWIFDANLFDGFYSYQVGQCLRDGKKDVKKNIIGKCKY